MARWLTCPLVAASLLLLAGCTDDDAQLVSGPISPPPAVDGVGIFQASFGFRDSPNTAYSGGGLLFSDGKRAIGGFCNSTKGFQFDYAYSRTGTATTGTVIVRGCPHATYWSGSTSGSATDNADQDFGPFDVTGASGDGRGNVESQSYNADLTERYLQLPDLAGSYASPGYRNGGLSFNGYLDVDATIDTEGKITLVGWCGPGTITIPSEGKNLARVSIANCHNGVGASGFIALDGNTIHVAMTVAGENGTFSGTAVRP